jgi:hypothetical protein
MALTVLTCPATNARVQHWLDAEDDVPNNEYEVIKCNASAGLHLINRKTSMLLGKQRKGTSAAAGLASGRVLGAQGALAYA